MWNEPLHLRHFLDRCNIWADTFKDAFRWAHEEDPDTKLCLNE